MSLYSHFEGKDELVKAVADEFVVRFVEAIRSVPRTNDALYDFVCMSHRYRAISLDNRDLYRVAMVSGRLSIDRDTPHGIREMFNYCVEAVGLMDRPDARGVMRTITVDADSPVRGIATSGRHGRSFSLGIADAVTVLARSAAQADAAATVIANSVDLPGHPAVHRMPANELQPDSDLGDRFVTRDVGALTELEIDEALEAGSRRARQLLAAGLIEGAALRLLGETVVVGAREFWAPHALHKPAVRNLLQHSHLA